MLSNLFFSRIIFNKAGTKDNESTQANATDAITAIDKSLNNCPIISDKKKKGIKTTTVVIAEAVADTET